MPSIAAVVVSLSDRHDLLKEALDSIHAQTREPDDVVIGVDPYRLGEVGNMNRLLNATDCDWVAFLHDDDLWDPEHLATVRQHLDDTTDVVVSRFRLSGRTHIEPWHTNFEDLRVTNWFPPSCVTARRDVFEEWTEPVGKFCWVDWANWNRLLDKDARFVDTGEVTVTYRFGPWRNGSWKGGTA